MSAFDVAKKYLEPEGTGGTEGREEAKRMAAANSTILADDPLLSVEQWYPEFHRQHMQVIAEVPDFDYGWLRQNRPDLYQRIKAKENEIDALEAARLSQVMEIMREWRRLIIEAEFDQPRGRLGVEGLP